MVDLVAIFLPLHVDEIHNDDAADPAQLHLIGDFTRRFQVVSQDRFFLIALPHKPAGIHIDHRHSLGMVDDQISSGLEPHLAAHRTGDFLLHAQVIEQAFFFVVEMNARRLLRRKPLDEPLDRVVLLAGINQEAVHPTTEEIAHDAKTQTQVAVQEARGRLLVTLRQYVLP